MKYVDCGTAGQNTQRVATKGVNNVFAKGAPSEFFWTPVGTEAPSIAAAQDKSTFDAWVAAANGVYLGKNEVESTGSERESYENAFFGLKVTITEATKTLQLSAPICPSTSAELEKMNGRSGLVWERSTLGYLCGRFSTSGKPQGYPVANIYKAINTIGTSSEPVENTVFEIPYSDPRGDQKNPFVAAITWAFSEIDQVNSVEAVLSNFADAGATLTFDLTCTVGGTGVVFTGATDANFSVSDANGADIATFTVSEAGATGVYSFVVTTGESVVDVQTDGITTVSSLLYNMDELRASA